MIKIINEKEKIAEYDNGNYHVTLLRDGTKIRENNLDFFRADFPESIDMTISKRCSQGCKYCYMNCTPDGRVANVYKNIHILDTIHPYTELALNGNDVNDIHLEPFLNEARKRNIICNLTVNQKHFLANKYKLLGYLNTHLIHGLGISLTNVTEGFMSTLLKQELLHPNMVFHTIAGILSKEDLDILSDHHLKLLVLGYKNIGRGKEYSKEFNSDIQGKIQFLKNNIRHYLNKFKVISFDNLALEQLDVKSWLENWDEVYMGDEGQFTFYIDLVNHRFYKSSLESESNGFSFDPTKDSVTDMFHKIRDLNG